MACSRQNWASAGRGLRRNGSSGLALSGDAHRVEGGWIFSDPRVRLKNVSAAVCGLGRAASIRRRNQKKKKKSASYLALAAASNPSCPVMPNVSCTGSPVPTPWKRTNNFLPRHGRCFCPDTTRCNVTRPTHTFVPHPPLFAHLGPPFGVLRTAAPPRPCCNPHSHVFPRGLRYYLCG